MSSWSFSPSPQIWAAAITVAKEEGRRKKEEGRGKKEERDGFSDLAILGTVF
ncbi:hypothetical protein [Kamptonema sp. UHCC 0994]|uniref:hypothetical protein n=1 Tax=Kamptonema sp. UHCC 0994 TaxID=3031329 RepID=UPI0023B8B873|nr:hypothetical protein [Kamptonema sp. UHCC 0994]MDF0556042.1 hypothetical protein [Kamptonema sp. UHCC 0994]